MNKLEPKLYIKRQVTLPFYFDLASNYLKEGKINNVAIEQFKVSQDDLIEYIQNGCYTQPDCIYTRLLINDQSVMTDMLFEQYTNLQVLENARGNVLIGGLGLGMILTRLISKPEITSITVIEKNQEVIDLVFPQFQKYYKYDVPLAVEKGDITNVTYMLVFLKKFPYDYIYTDILFDSPPIANRNKLDSFLRFNFLAPNGMIEHWEGVEYRIRASIEEEYAEANSEFAESLVNEY